MDKEYSQSNSWSLSRRKAMKMMGLTAATTAATLLEFSTHKSQSNATNSSTNGLSPYVISPRNTFVDTRRPQLRWNPVMGATSYTVKIVADADIVWQQAVQAAELNPSKDLPLEVGVDYSLIVESDNGRSSKMDSAPSLLVFGLLDEAQKAALFNELSQVNHRELPEDKKIRAIIDVYTSYGLNAKAIALLTQKIENESVESPLLYQELGNLYQCMGFYQLSEGQYRQALALTTDEQVQEKISSQTELKEVLNLMGRDREAKIVKAELEAFKLRNLDRIDCSASCSGKCGECCKDGDPRNPGKWYGNVCLTAGC